MTWAWTQQPCRDGPSYVRQDWKFRVRRAAHGGWYVQFNAAPGSGWHAIDVLTSYDTHLDAIASIKEDEDMAKEFQTFSVRGTWPFPTDMLRYDDAKPATGADADLIKALEGNDPSLAELREPTEIKLIRPKRGYPTDARWRSFGWRVVGGDPDVEADVQWRDALRERDALRASGLAKLTPAERSALGVDKR